MTTHQHKEHFGELTLEQWVDLVDQLGLAGSIDGYRELLNLAPQHIKESHEYKWVVGFVNGRALHEEFGGV